MTPRRPRDDDWMFDPDLAAMNRRLHHEIREEAAEDEFATAESELRERTMNDVAMHARNRGDYVAVATSSRVFTGRVAYAASDVISVRAESYEADINLAAASYIKVIERGRGGGLPRPDGPGTFEMRLVERKSPTNQIEIGYRAISETLIGRLTTVGQDHVVVVDQHKTEWVVPTNAIAFVIRRDRIR